MDPTDQSVPSAGACRTPEDGGPSPGAEPPPAQPRACPSCRRAYSPPELSHSQAPNPCTHTTSGLAVPPSTSASLLDTAHERPGPLVLGCARTHITRSAGGPSSFQLTVGGRLSLQYELPLTDHERNPNCGSFLLQHRVGKRKTPRVRPDGATGPSYLHHGIEASVRAHAQVRARNTVANGGRQDANGNTKLLVAVAHISEQNGALESLKQRCGRSAGLPQHPLASCVHGARGVGALGLQRRALREWGHCHGAQASKRRGRKQAGSKAGAGGGAMLVVDEQRTFLGSSEALREANWVGA